MSSGSLFDPRFSLEQLGRAELAVLGREYLLAGHLQDRASMPQILARYGLEAMRDVAISEWMGASPIYTRRMQRALAFEGDDVATVFKGLQLDIGAPHQFMDFRFSLADDGTGEFWLDCCGALMDVEPMGEPFVVAMCHDIEDPTFDATAAATNPRARMRPIHRPPRDPPGREPHCRWRVFIDPDAEPIELTAHCRRVAESRAAAAEITRPADGEPGGRPDYSGPFDPDFQLEALAHGALVMALEEFCLQGHLLVRSLSLTLTERFGEDLARDVLRAQFTGVAPVAARRVAAAMGIEGGGVDAVARMLQLHPALYPRSYVGAAVDVERDRVRLSVRGGDALEEGDAHSWLALLGDGTVSLDPVVQAVDPRSRCERSEPRPGERLAWEVVVDPAAQPAPEPEEVGITRVSTGADFVFIRRRAVK